MSAARPEKLLLGLIGSEIQASRTPAMHEHEARGCGISCLYQLIDLAKLRLDVKALYRLLQAAEWMGFGGLNITYPCKQAVLPLLTEISEDAQALGAVNAVVLRDGRRSGHNTDWQAFARSFRESMQGARIEKVVQLGSGGGGSATAYAMLTLGAGHLTIIDPDTERSRALVARLAALFGTERVHTGNDLAMEFASADGLVHASPIGMYGHEGLAVPKDLLRPSLWVAEIVYFPLETELLIEAKRRGCRTINGSGMAVYQAAESFRLFTGLEPDVDRMRRHFVSMVET